MINFNDFLSQKSGRWKFSLHFVVTAFALQIVHFVSFVLCGIRVLFLRVLKELTWKSYVRESLRVTVIPLISLALKRLSDIILVCGQSLPIN